MKALSFQYLSSLVNSFFQKKVVRQAHVLGKDDDDIPLIWHIQEFRRYALRALLWLAFFTCLSFLFMHPIVNFLKHPYSLLINNINKEIFENNLTTISIFEVITTNFEICVLCGFIMSLPFLLKEIWNFIAPALYVNEKKIALYVMIASTILFYTGITISYFVIIPYFFSNTLTWAGQYAYVMITYNNYFDSLTTMILIFGLVFEMPVILSLLALAELISSQLLIENRKIVFLASFIVGAIVSPPELLCLCLVSLPLYLMMEISILIIKKIEERRGKNISIV